MTKKSISRLLQASLMCCLAVLFTACEDFGMESNPTPSYISFNSKAVTLNIEQTVTYKAIVAGTAVVIYSSSNEAVATVDQAGKVTAVSEGTATITALVTGYDAAGRKIYTPEEKSYTVTVVDPVESLTLDQTALSVGIGATKTITATVNPAGYTVMWTSSDESVAIVENGVVTGVAEGTATITAKAGGKVKTCAVTVSAAWAANEYNEGSWDSTNKKVVFTKQTAASVTALTNSVTSWSGWYTVSGDVTITGDVGLTADTHLILQDGAKLTITGKLDGYAAALARNLYIYGQEKGDGKLIVENNSGTAIQIGDKAGSGKDIEIHGGEITAKATGVSGPGIYSRCIRVYGGKLTAESKAYMGIQFGMYGEANNFDVYGGEVVATSNATSSSDARYGITSVDGSATQILKVYGGKVTATGNGKGISDDYGSGIGCYVWSATSGIKFYFSDDGTTWGNGFNYGIANSVGFGNDNPDTQKRYAKAE